MNDPPKVHFTLDGKATMCHRLMDTVALSRPNAYRNGDHIITVVGIKDYRKVTCKKCLEELGPDTRKRLDAMHLPGGPLA
jgi:NADPH-dependent curcumin reductase CurA